MTRRPLTGGTVKFLLVAIAIMLFVDLVVWRDGRPYRQEVAQKPAIPQSSMPSIEPTDQPAAAVQSKSGQSEDSISSNIDDGDFIDDLFFDDEQDNDEGQAVPLLPPADDLPIVEPPAEESDNETAIPKAVKIYETYPEQGVEGAKRPKGRIAIVIDDVGVNLKQSRAALALPSAVTLSFLPYADQARPLAAQAKAEGHEIMLHIPMEAMSSDVPLGPNSLTTGMSDIELAQSFAKMTEGFDGLAGVNNHMGSKLTQDRAAMERLMLRLRERGLYFLDSRTIAASVAEDVANDMGVPTTARDIFIDHAEDTQSIYNALANIERIAGEHGQVIAIAHPKENTMLALKAWLPTLEEKGYTLVPLSRMINEQ